MHPTRFLLSVVLLLVPAALRADSKEAFFFKEGDRIVFLGDSITEQYQYSTDIELYLTTRFPKWNLTFINAGIGGDTANGGASRFQGHVLDEKPTAVTIDFGMNDAGYGAFNPQANAFFLQRTEEMLKMAKNAGVRVALISPNAVDRRVQERFRLYLETQKQFYAPLKDLAAKYGVPFVNQYAMTRAALEKMEKDGAKNVRPFGDGFHTAPPGGLFMAHAILTGLHAPALVSDVSINEDGKAETKSCTVADVRRAGSELSFDRTDDSLPMPIQNDWVSLLPYVNELKDMNWYGLKIAGFKEGKYALLIDGKPVAGFTASELAAGVNLGNLTTGPIHEQGLRVFQAINNKNDIVHQRFRGVVMFNAPDWLQDVAAERKPKELAKKMDQINSRQAEIYKMVQPKKHRFEVKPAE